MGWSHTHALLTATLRHFHTDVPMHNVGMQLTIIFIINFLFIIFGLSPTVGNIFKLSN